MRAQQYLLRSSRPSFSLRPRSDKFLISIRNMKYNSFADINENRVKLCFFEIKGFTLQAKALLISERLKKESKVQEYFPDYDYLKEFALKFENASGFPLIYKNKQSRDFLFAVNWDKEKDPQIKSL